MFPFPAFMAVTLSTLAIVLGGIIALLNLAGLIQPQKFAEIARKFPRNEAIGYLLMAAGTVWFLLNVSHESLADFENMKNGLFALFIAIAIGTCIFVRDFLAVRGLAIVLLLVAKLMVDTERWANTEWRLVIAVLAYIFVIAGMWLTVSPWRLRDAIHWDTANPQRMRLFCALRLGLGLFIAILGFVVF
jgi:hypothetical protein